MRKTFVLGKLAGTTSRIVLLESALSRTASTRSALEASTPAGAKSTESVTVH
jgi:hypothetical protein